jgi:hypothetical protein
VPKLVAAIADRAALGSIDPHQERVQVLGLDESIGSCSTYTLFLRRYGSDDRLLEPILVSVAHADR